MADKEKFVAYPVLADRNGKPVVVTTTAEIAEAFHQADLERIERDVYERVRSARSAGEVITFGGSLID